jgi:hypothetical protein
LSLALTSGAHAATAGTSVDKPTLNTLEPISKLRAGVDPL